jgi:hypothetical protein
MRNHYPSKLDSPHAGYSKPPVGRNIALCALLLAGSAAAQMAPNSITDPVLGLVFDAETQSIRAVVGIPAASRVGAALDAGTPLSAVAISSERAYALGVEDGTGAAVLVSQAGRHLLPGIRAGAQQTAVSPRGTAAAVYFGDTGKVSVLTGLPDAPQVLREVTLDGTPTALAVSDDGTGLAAVVNLTANEATAFSYPAAGAGQALLRDRGFAALEFMPGSATLLLATETAVYQYQGRQGLQSLTDQRDGIANVVGAAASADGAQVFIAMKSGQVAVLNLADSSQTLLSCSCEPAGMWRLRGKAVFRLNEPGAGPVWIVDGDAVAPRILFVAAPSGDNR